MNKKLAVYNEASLNEAISELRQAHQENRFLRLTIRSNRGRSLVDNAHSWVWYREISDFLGDLTVEEAHCLCKLEYGVPILMGNNPDFAAFYIQTMERIPYEDRLKAIKYLSITSVMTDDEMGEYLRDIKRAFSQQGLILE